MTLNEQLTQDLKTAMKAKDKNQLNVVRMIKTALKNAEIAKNAALTPDEELSVLSTELKQRRESLVEFEKGQRADLVAQIKEEIKIVQNYMPKQLSEAEVQAIVKETITDVHATSPAQMGAVMAKIMPKVKGRADGAMINRLVKSELTTH